MCSDFHFLFILFYFILFYFIFLQEEKEAKAAENAARAALSADPSNQKLLQEIEKARADISQARPA